MAETYGPFDAGAGASLGEDPYMDVLGPANTGGDGVVGYPPNSSSLQVYGASAGMSVFVRAGKAVVRGGLYRNTADITKTISANSSGATRIDRLVLRHDRTANTITPVVLPGTPGAGVPPAVTRTEGGTWDVLLAQVTVPNGAITITSSQVRDERDFLPQSVPVLYGKTLPVDGSGGSFYYDYGTHKLMITDGTAWKALGVASDRSVHVNPVSGSLANGGATFRNLGDVVEMTVDSTYNFGSAGGALLTAPSGYRPAGQVDGYFTDGVAIDGHFVLGSSGLLTLTPMPGLAFGSGYRAQFKAIYLAA